MDQIYWHKRDPVSRMMKAMQDAALVAARDVLPPEKFPEFEARIRREYGALADVARGRVEALVAARKPKKALANG